MRMKKETSILVLIEVSFVVLAYIKTLYGKEQEISIQVPIDISCSFDIYQNTLRKGKD